MSLAPLPLHIACATGFSGDRDDSAAALLDTLATLPGPACLIYETLAERTLALAQQRRRADPEAGYEPRLQALLSPVLARCLAAGIPIVGNFGAANPPAAARLIQAMAASAGLPAPRIAVIAGDDLSAPEHRPLLDDALAGSGAAPGPLVSANVYLGAHEIAAALRAGAQIVVAGRVADPALALGPALAHFGWAEDDWDAIAGATLAGHLLECGAQVSGGYFADPGFKPVPDLAHVGFPIATLHADGRCEIHKAAHTGGCVTERTVKEQLLYEIHDPAAYLTPDVVLDLSEVSVRQLGPDRVLVAGMRGHPRPPTLKLNACFEGGWYAEGEISYAGPGAEGRARLAGAILRERLAPQTLRVDLLGVLSLFADDAGRQQQALNPGEADDVRLRVACQSATAAEAERLLREVEALYTCGPAGGGGVRTALRPRLSLLAGLIPRTAVTPHWSFLSPLATEATA